ncbi:unnamed protein product [Coffea canephora]|uniref:Uncharacterized protein n=1 Tax=Coffea canephora TaxID=49390 RepID=A0A068UDL9_COFCA|nr:unnamed protein product [Coffea canephora]
MCRICSTASSSLQIPQLHSQFEGVAGDFRLLCGQLHCGEAGRKGGKSSQKIWFVLQLDKVFFLVCPQIR